MNHLHGSGQITSSIQYKVRDTVFILITAIPEGHLQGEPVWEGTMASTLRIRASSIYHLMPDGPLPALPSPNTPACSFLHSCIDSPSSKSECSARLAAQAPRPAAQFQLEGTARLLCLRSITLET